MLSLDVQIILENQYNSSHKLPQVPIGQAVKENMAGEDQAANMLPLQYSYVCSGHFLPGCFEGNIRSQITDRGVNTD